MLKKIVLTLLAIFGVALIAALFVEGKMHYEKSISINAPIEKVWAYTSSLKGLDQWSPWNEKDPNMKKTFEGTDGAPGAKQCWVGNEEVGEGCQTIKAVSAPTELQTTLLFKKPYENQAAAYVRLLPEGANTKATWGFDGEAPYPFRLFNLFMNFEKMMGADYQKGLEKLKALSEQP